MRALYLAYLQLNAYFRQPPWFRITAGQKDYAGRMKQMEESRNEHYAALGIPPGPPTSKGIWGEPACLSNRQETTGQALTNKPLGNYDIPDNWPRPPVKNPPGDVPGPPVQYGPPVNPDQIGTPCRHPLYIAFANHSASAASVVMRHLTFIGYRHRFETAVWMNSYPSWFIGWWKIRVCVQQKCLFHP